jgi:hypothetical protein
MANIQKRIYKNGRVTYKVRFRKNAYPEYSVSVTFLTLEAAHEFVEAYEPIFDANPKMMLELKDKMRADMQSRGIYTEDGMLKPRFRTFL